MQNYSDLNSEFGTPPYRLTAGTRFACSNVHNFDGAKGRAGAQTVVPRLQPGERRVIADLPGPGLISRIWLTFDWPDRHRYEKAMLRNRTVSLEIRWDGADSPAVCAPIGDLFCHPLSYDIPFENAWFADPVGRSCLCFLPMPFRKQAEISVVNEFDRPVSVFHDIRFSQGFEPDPDDGYLHACFARTIPAQPGPLHRVLPEIHGRGRYLGMHLGIITDRFNPLHWHGGHVNVFVDGDQEYPSMMGASLDDYGGSAWLYEQCFMHQDSGLLLSRSFSEGGGGHYGMYFYHRRDPLVFEKSCSVSIRPGSHLNAASWLALLDAHPGLAERISIPYSHAEIRTAVEKNQYLDFIAGRLDDLSSVALFYLDRPEGVVPPCPAAILRAPAWRWPAG